MSTIPVIEHVLLGECNHGFALPLCLFIHVMDQTVGEYENVPWIQLNLTAEVIKNEIPFYIISACDHATVAVW